MRVDDGWINRTWTEGVEQKICCLDLIQHRVSIGHALPCSRRGGGGTQWSECGRGGGRGEKLSRTLFTGKRGTLPCGVGQGEPGTDSSNSILSRKPVDDFDDFNNWLRRFYLFE